MDTTLDALLDGEPGVTVLERSALNHGLAVETCPALVEELSGDRSPDPVYVGIDNGVSGSVGVLHSAGGVRYFGPAPVFESQDYTKHKKTVRRIETNLLRSLLGELRDARVFIERPTVNPKRFAATTSALRAFEATLIVVEALLLPYQVIDSRKWQSELLPSGCKGSDALKKASHDLGLKLFPSYGKAIAKQGDADALLIAEYARRNRL